MKDYGKIFGLSSANENLMVIHPDGPHCRIGNIPISLALQRHIRTPKI